MLHIKQRIKNQIRVLLSFLNKQGIAIQQVSQLEAKHDSALYQNYDSLYLQEKRFYNIGAGNFKHPYWTNVDYSTKYYSGVQNHPFINHNLMSLTDLPIENNSAAVVYSSHTIEHISDAAVAKLLSETHRILTRGGVVRLTAPDASLDWRAYHASDKDFWYWRWERFFNKSNNPFSPMINASIEQLLMLHLFTQLSSCSIDTSTLKQFTDEEVAQICQSMKMEEAFNYFAQYCRFNSNYPGNHINWWTKEKAFEYLKYAGFKEIYISAYGQSIAPPLRNTCYFDNTMPKISFYIEAVKTD